MIALSLILSLANPAPMTHADLLLGAIDVVLSPMNIAAVDLTEDHAVEVATDANNRRYLRVRATGALGIFGSARAHATLLDLARHDTDVEVRVQAVISLVRWFAEPAPGALFADMRALAEDAPPTLRRVIERQLAGIAP